MNTTVVERDRLILSYLDRVNGLLRFYASSAHLELEDLRQDASIVIMRCLERPGQANLAYITTSVRHRIIDKIRKGKREEAVSLDAPTNNDQSGDVLLTLADFLPGRTHQTDPLAILLLREQIEDFAAGKSTKYPTRHERRRTGPGSRHRELIDTVLASLPLSTQWQAGVQL